MIADTPGTGAVYNWYFYTDFSVNGQVKTGQYFNAKLCILRT